LRRFTARPIAASGRDIAVAISAVRFWSGVFPPQSWRSIGSFFFLL